MNFKFLRSALVGSVSALVLASAARAENFDIPGGDLQTALSAYAKQTNVALIYPDDEMRNTHTRGAQGNLSPYDALSRLLRGTGFTTQRTPSGAIGIVRAAAPSTAYEDVAQVTPVRVAAAANIESVVVTSSKIKGDIQTVPIAITALSQEQLTSRQIAGGPDLVKEVPNLTFSKTNFSGYNIEIRGIGTQAISVSTDPAVAVAFNDIPFIRNHFFEQEFYDLENVEILRGPQGTLYGRNATAGVVNVISAKPTDQFEAMLSADWGNYLNRRYEAMINIPVVDDKLAIRAAAEWTKRNGYSINDVTGAPIDGRDLWSSRVTVGWKPASDVQTFLVWEHFQENDDRIRSSKQLCTPVPTPAAFEGVPVNGGALIGENQDWLSQGCSDASLYSPNAYGVPDGKTLPFWTGLEGTVSGLIGDVNPYAGATQSRNLRVISSDLNPTYRAKNDTLEFNADWRVTPSLTLTSQTGYNNDFLWSTEDYNRFTTTPDVYNLALVGFSHYREPPLDVGVDAGDGHTFCDPQLGCSNRMEAEDLSTEHAWQLSQEFRLASNFDGPLNFSVGGNYLHYETVEDYYVFINALTLIALWPDNRDYLSNRPVPPWQPGVSDNSWCLKQPHQYTLGGSGALACSSIDPDPLGSLNNQGHNYFLSQNPYVLNSYAGFGEVYYNVTNDLKLTAGARWTDDQKHFLSIPSEVLTQGYGYPVLGGAIDQQWNQWTGRAVAQWTPKLDFTDQTLVYASVAHGYKAGGANPPGAELLTYFSSDTANPIHPPTFKPEFINAFELGTKNSLLDNSLTLNADAFYYNYTGYQISRIVDRSAINDNFNAHIVGAEFEANWEPLPGLKFTLAQGFEDARLNNGARSVDLMDRTAGVPGWSVVRPFVTNASNCILPNYVILTIVGGSGSQGAGLEPSCGRAYGQGVDPATGATYVANPAGFIENTTGTTYLGNQLITVCPGGIGCGVQYPGFDPLAGTPGDPYTGQNTDNRDGIDYGPAPNNGQGFDKNLSHHNLPNAPHLTTSFSAEYTMPVSENWAATLHGDFYWQSQQWARVFADPIDKIRPYSTTNLALILTSGDGWQVMGYVKNIFDATAITGTFLNSDDTDLTTNVFLTDPRLFGIRVTKHFDQGSGFWGNSSGDATGGIPPLWVEFGGQFDLLDDSQQKIDPPFFAKVSDAGFASPLSFEKAPKTGLEENAKISFAPDSDWVLSASVRYGRNGTKAYKHEQTNQPGGGFFRTIQPSIGRFRYEETTASSTESHEIFDFMIGKDVGLGVLGAGGTSTLSGGMRFAQFRSKSALAVYSDPDYVDPNTRSAGITGPKYFHNFDAKAHDKTSFTGIGPAISWDASTPLSGDAADGQITFDWGLNGAVLFGRQKSVGYHETKGKLTTGVVNFPPIFYYHTTHYTHGGPHDRSRSVTVPNLGASAGLSFKYQNAKVSFGYRIDEFFGAMDGGIDAHKSYNFGDSGPFVNMSLGLGG
ncbi:MAG TPA: TonB-dependent receptor [Rhizomicrobium sp.]|nr:TonB-dependent receptor [Rhizomicrobium sp.]